MITDQERIGIEEGIFIEDRNDAIRALQEWTLDRLLEWDDDIRPKVAQTLIDRVSEFRIEPPDLWLDIVVNNSKYNSLRDDIIEDDIVSFEDDITSRPTEMAEKEILEIHI